MTNYPKWFVPALVGTLLLMFASGMLLAPTTLTMRAEWDLPWRLPGNARVPVAALHAAGGFVSMLLIGALWSVHMRSGWRRRKQRVSGTVLGGLLLLLAATALAVYYVGDDTLGSAAAVAHLILGLALAVPFAWHWARGRKRRRRQRAADRTDPSAHHARQPAPSHRRHAPPAKESHP
jgi:heme A synthase